MTLCSTGLPVLPIHLAGLQAILPKGSSAPRPGPLLAQVGAPIRLRATASHAEIVAQLEGAMRELAARAEREQATRGSATI